MRDKPEVRCPDCGALHIVKKRIFPTPQSGVVRCYVCDKVLAAFRDRTVPIYMLRAKKFTQDDEKSE